MAMSSQACDPKHQAQQRECWEQVSRWEVAVGLSAEDARVRIVVKRINASLRKYVEGHLGEVFRDVRATLGSVWVF